MKWISFTILALFIVFIMGCGQAGGFRDIARIRQAERNLRRVRNSLEEYRVDNGCYPGSNVDLKEALWPYFIRVIHNEGKDAPKYSAIVTDARDRVENIRNKIGGARILMEEGIKEDSTRLKVAFENIEMTLNNYESALAAERGTTLTFLPQEECDTLMKFIRKENPNLKLKALKDSLIILGDSILSESNSLISTFIDTSAISDTSIVGDTSVVSDDSVVSDTSYATYLKNISSSFERYRIELSGKRAPPGEIYSPEEELQNLKGALEDDSFIVEKLEGMLEAYTELKDSRNIYEGLIEAMDDLRRAKILLAGYEREKKENVSKYSIILIAQKNLRKIADAIEAFRKKEGVYPGNMTMDDIEELAHPYFVERTISGEVFDRWESSMGFFIEGPTYNSSDSTSGFILEAKVNDKDNTPIFYKATLKNSWDEIVSIFASGPNYTTPDSTETYFLTARANDSGKTIVTDRPPVTL